MAAGFEYFDHTSSGAPILHGAAGRMIALLDWVLVTKGGWAKEFSGTNLAAYRSATGNRMFYRVDDTQALYARVRGQRGMTGISAGLTGQFPSNGQAGNINTWGVRKAWDASASTDPQRYWGIRTNRYLVLVVESISQLDLPSTGASYRNILVIGDVPSLCEADSYCSVICGQHTSDSQYQSWREAITGIGIHPLHNLPVALVGAAFSGSPNGSIVSPASAVFFGYPYSDSGSGPASALSQSDRMFFMPVLAGSTNSATVGSNGTYPRASLANLQALYGPAADGVPEALLPATDLVAFTIGSRQFLPILSLANGTGQFPGDALLLEVTDTDGAL